MPFKFGPISWTPPWEADDDPDTTNPWNYVYRSLDPKVGGVLPGGTPPTIFPFNVLTGDNLQGFFLLALIMAERR